MPPPCRQRSGRFFLLVRSPFFHYLTHSRQMADDYPSAIYERYRNPSAAVDSGADQACVVAHRPPPLRPLCELSRTAQEQRKSSTP
jgi:hypothetical protein